MKIKINTWDLTALKSFCIAKETTTWWRDSPQNGRKYLQMKQLTSGSFPKYKSSSFSSVSKNETAPNMSRRPKKYMGSSAQFSRSVVSNSLWLYESQHPRPPCPSPTPWSSLRLTSIESVMPSSHHIHSRPLLLLPPIPPSISLFQWVNSSHKVAKVLEFQF